MPVVDCRYFNGYKPCGKSEICDHLCPHQSIPQLRILLIHLGALGAVARSTALLPAIRRKYPGAHLTWVTEKSASALLANHESVDRVLTTSEFDLLQLSALEFDIALVIDKSLQASGILRRTQTDLIYGFRADPRTGAILPATEAARELWQVGLSNHKKFYLNQKPESQLVHEALELGPWRRDEYSFQFSASEQREISLRHASWSVQGRQTVVGINTGCSDVIEYKKLTIEAHRQLIARLKFLSGYQVVLLGGREDELRNQRIAYGSNAIQTPTDRGLRDGMMSVAACDVVVSGDSLGLHLAIGLKKWTVAWFGPTCAQEIDLYDRGVKVMTKATCGPCWKRQCNNNPMCYDLVDLDEIIAGIQAGVRQLDIVPCERTSPYPDSLSR